MDKIHGVESVLTIQDADFGLEIYNTTRGRCAILRIGVVLPVVVERGLVVVHIEVRDVVVVVPRAHIFAGFPPYSPEIESGHYMRSRLFSLRTVFPERTLYLFGGRPVRIGNTRTRNRQGVS